MSTHMTLPSVTKTWHRESYPAISPLSSSSTAGKFVLISGAGTGIGAETTLAFAEAGATAFALLGRTAATLEETAAKVKSQFPSVQEVQVIVTDISSKSAVAAAFSIIAKIRPIDIFVNNAAYFPNIGMVADLDADEFAKGFAINVTGSLLLIQGMLANAAPDAVIIHVSSCAAHMPYITKSAPYATSKIAATKLFEYVQAENPHLRVFNIQPGVIDTPMLDKAAGQLGRNPWPKDDIKLPAHFAVWLTREAARPLKGKFLWANWDVEELLELEAAKAEGALTIGLDGWKQTFIDVPLEL